MAFVWDRETFRYVDVDTGEPLDPDEVLNALDDSLDYSLAAARQIAVEIDSGDLHPTDAERQFHNELDAAYIRQWMLGKGGKDNMTLSDWFIIGTLLAVQYRFLKRFMNALNNPLQVMPVGEINRRLDMYIDSSRQAFERGKALAFGIPQLPAYPGDGSTLCLTRCKCHWEIHPVSSPDPRLSGWNCYWRLGIAEHCETCLRREAAWAPLFVSVDGTMDLITADLFAGASA